MIVKKITRFRDGSKIPRIYRDKASLIFKSTSSCSLKTVLSIHISLQIRLLNTRSRSIKPERLEAQVASLNCVAVCELFPPQAPLGNFVLILEGIVPPPPPQASAVEMRGGLGWHVGLERSPNSAGITQQREVLSPHLCIPPLSKNNTHIPV